MFRQLKWKTMYQNLQTAPKAVLGGENSNKCLPKEIRKDK